MFKSIKVRLYPNKQQIEQINELLGCYRFVYNKCLERKIKSYKTDKTNETLKSLGYYLHNDLTKDSDYEWLTKQNTKVLKQAIINMLEAYNRFFKVKGTGFPKFKSKKDNKLSCRFPLEAISKRNDYTTNKLSLANIKNIKFRCSDKYVEQLSNINTIIKSATLSKTSSMDYYLSFLVETNENIILNPSDNFIGLDLGIKDFIVASNGQVFDNMKFKKNKINKLKRLQRQLSKKQKDSNNRNKARIKLNKCYDKINNQTNNYLHLISKQLINENQVICVEDLNVKGMINNHKLAESIQTLSFGKFVNILEYKCLFHGRVLSKVDKFYPSTKLCNVCNYKNNELTLKDREWVCPSCLTKHDRDYNASINILNEGLRILG